MLVRLTSLFAEHRAVPVPIRLRDATEGLNFREMAHTRFLAMAESSMLSADDAEKVWRQLSKDDKIIVIADGLEEALTEGTASVQEDRDNLIRLAIHRARELRLPLIIASRPHDPLRGADATIMELEPLSEEAALEYIDPRRSKADARWLDWIVETAGLTELPLYLQITRQLFRTGRLDYLSAERAARVDIPSMDHSGLRVYLLNTWMEALFEGHLMGAVPLKRAEREAAVMWLSALACIGLLGDTIDVKYEDYHRGKPARQLELSPPPKYQKIHDAIQSFPAGKLPRRPDIRLAVTWGDQLNLVEADGEGLRFPHSIMQAYLASRFMCTALQDPRFRQDAVNECSDEARQELALWLERVRREQESDGSYFHLSLEVALAQGFKYAANRRLHHPHALRATRDYMAEQALGMLKSARFWFTQLTLIHALCLWEMPDPSTFRDDKTGRRGNSSNAANKQPHERGSNPEAPVGHWLKAAKNGKHPFVAQAGKLAVEALKTGQPERFLWIDESGIVSSVGSRAAQACEDRKHHLWIPPSAGGDELDRSGQLYLPERYQGRNVRME